MRDVASAAAELKRHLESEARSIEQAAVNGLMSIHADDRQQVRAYYKALWRWNRLERNRWKKAKVTLRQKSRRHRRQNRLEVDHIVAYNLWQSKLKTGYQPLPHHGEAVTEDGVVGAVRRWRVRPGISVARFSAEPMNKAILRASSERNSRARSGNGEASPLRFVMVAASLSSTEDSPWTGDAPVIFSRQ
jgi:hypothetical protein